jgi:hypothetical protein
MARLITAGFETQTTAGNSEGFSVVTGSPAISTVTYRSGAAALEIGSLGSGTREAIGNQYVAAEVGGDTYYFRAYLYVATAPSADNTIIAFATTTGLSTHGINVKLTSSRTLDVYQGTTNLATGSTALSLNTWYRVEIAYKRDAATPNANLDYFELKIDGATEDSSTTASIASACNHVGIGGNLKAEAQTQGSWFFDDVALNDSTGAAQTSWPGSGKIVFLKPTGTGTYDEPTATGAATNWECVDEVPKDDATTYAAFTANSSGWTIAGSRLLMQMQGASDVSIGANDTVTLVGVGWFAAAATAATMSLIAGIRSGGSNADMSGSQTLNTTGYSHIDDGARICNVTPQYTDPTDSMAWTVAKIDAMEIGLRCTDSSPNGLVSAVWAVVEYVPAAAASGNSKALPLLGVGSILPLGLLYPAFWRWQRMRARVGGE